MLPLPFDLSLNFTGGEIPYALTFTCTDVVSEIWGRKRAGFTVMCGLFANLIAMVMISAARLFPGAPYWENEAAFSAILGSTFRIMLASIAAFIVSQFHDIWMYELLRRATQSRWLWIRNNVSTILSQTIDTSIFTVLAFYGVAPVIPLIIGQLTAKAILAVLDTPLVYAMVKLLKRRATAEATPA